MFHRGSQTSTASVCICACVRVSVCVCVRLRVCVRMSDAACRARDAAMDELVSSERTYCRSLCALRDVFETPLQLRSRSKQFKLLEPNAIERVFNNIGSVVVGSVSAPYLVLM